MTTTATAYRAIARDLPTALAHKASEASVKQETQYFKDNIGKIKSIDQFFANNRIYTFAMKAYGLADMIDSRGFMRKVLVGERDSNGLTFAEKLKDPRFKDFAAAFNFRSYGEDLDSASIDSEIKAIAADYRSRSSRAGRSRYDDETARETQYIFDMAKYLGSAADIVEDSKLNAIFRATLGLPPASTDDSAETQAHQIESVFYVPVLKDPDQLSAFVDRVWAARNEGRKALVDPYARATGTYAGSDEEIAKQVQYFRDKMHGVATVKDLLSDPTLSDIVRTTLALPAPSEKDSLDVQANQVSAKFDLAALRNPARLDAFIDRFKAAHAQDRQATVDSYLRQTIETDAGDEDEGVRLALYFQRKAAGGIKSVYTLLADPALAQVARTVAGLPPEAAKVDLDKQARIIASKIDVPGLKNPAEVERLLTRFTAIWDSKNNKPAGPALSFLGSSSGDLDAGLLLQLQNIRLGAR